MSSDGIERGADAAERRDEIGEPFEREVLAVERNQDRVGGDERVEREQPERRRRVDEDVVEAAARSRSSTVRRRCSRCGSETSSISAPGQIAVGRDERESGDGRRQQKRRGSSTSVGQRLVDRAGCRRLPLQANAARQIALRVHVDEEDALVRERQRGGRLMAVVVLPTPPFWLATARIRAVIRSINQYLCESLLKGSGSITLGEGHGATTAISFQLSAFSSQRSGCFSFPLPACSASKLRLSSIRFHVCQSSRDSIDPTTDSARRCSWLTQPRRVFHVEHTVSRRSAASLAGNALLSMARCRARHSVLGGFGVGRVDTAQRLKAR